MFSFCLVEIKEYKQYYRYVCKRNVSEKFIFNTQKLYKMLNKGYNLALLI